MGSISSCYSCTPIRIFYRQMRYLVTMQQLFSIFVFYRPLILWSFGVNSLLVILNYGFIPFLLLKLFLVIFLWYLINETQAKRKLTFYKNLGISTFKLLTFVYIIDAVISLPYYLILKEFV